MQAQLHWLWTEVERKKEEVAQLSEKLESETRKMELDKALQVQVHMFIKQRSYSPPLE